MEESQGSKQPPLFLGGPITGEREIAPAIAFLYCIALTSGFGGLWNRAATRESHAGALFFRG